MDVFLTSRKTPTNHELKLLSSLLSNSTNLVSITHLSALCIDQQGEKINVQLKNVENVAFFTLTTIPKLCIMIEDI